MTDEGWAGWPQLVVEKRANLEQVTLDEERVDSLQKQVEGAKWEGGPLVEVAVGL